MSLSTTARPYAQALFDHSEGWTEDLEQIVSAMSDAAVGLLIASPDKAYKEKTEICLLYTSPSPRDQRGSRMPSSA